MILRKKVSKIVRNYVKRMIDTNLIAIYGLVTRMFGLKRKTKLKKIRIMSLASNLVK